MTRTVRTKEPGFTRVPHALSRDARISNGARGLAVQMLSHVDGFRSDAEFLAQFTPEGRDAVRSQLAELRKYSYLVRERVRGPRGQITTRSVLYDTPQVNAQVEPTGGKPATRSEEGRYARPSTPPTGGKPATRSQQEKRASTSAAPGAGNPPHGPTSQDTQNPLVEPTGGKPATRLDQDEQAVFAGRTGRRETRLQVLRTEEEQKEDQFGDASYVGVPAQPAGQTALIDEPAVADRPSRKTPRKRKDRSPEEQARFEQADQLAKAWWAECERRKIAVLNKPRYPGFRAMLESALRDATELELKNALIDIGEGFPTISTLGRAISRRRGAATQQRQGRVSNNYAEDAAADQLGGVFE